MFLLFQSLTPPPPRSAAVLPQGSLRKEFPANIGGSDVCFFCRKRVYVMERLSAEGKFFHRSCFKCEYCGTTLRLSSYAFDVEDGKNGATPGGGGMAEERCCFLFSHSSFLLPREVLLQAALLLPRVRLCPEEAARSPRSSRPRQGTPSVARSCCLSANAHPCSVRPPAGEPGPPGRNGSRGRPRKGGGGAPQRAPTLR